MDQEQKVQSLVIETASTHQELKDLKKKRSELNDKIKKLEKHLYEIIKVGIAEEKKLERD